MFDFMPRPASGGYAERSYRELILKKMRPGDIHTHCYAAHIPSLCEDGTVNPDVLEAQKRGVLFDLGHGAGSFVWKHAAPAVQQGYLPNTISTDLHGNNTASGKVVSQINVMSKMLSLGLSLEQVVRRSTVHAAEAIRRPELGRLSVGSPADIAVIRVTQGDVGYVDTSGGKFIGRRRMECAMTVFAGRVVFDPHGMSVPLWQDIPRGSKYYRPPRQPW
jgi:dihydroorotase